MDADTRVYIAVGAAREGLNSAPASIALATFIAGQALAAGRQTGASLPEAE